MQRFEILQPQPLRGEPFGEHVGARIGQHARDLRLEFGGTRQAAGLGQAPARQAALAAKQAFPDLPIMLMTGYAEQRERARSLDAIVSEVMTKPFTIAELRTAVLNVIERSIG
jgi:hypothetical protein